jgi:hypothetical protein
LAQVRPQVIGILQADAQAKETRGHACCLPTGPGLERRVDSAEAGRVLDQLQPKFDLTRYITVGDVE